MPVDLPTYTNIWRIEKRLYKVYDLRLPMPLPLGQIAAFAAITVPYLLLLTLIGVPFSHSLFWLYVLPPWALTWLATRPVIENKRLPELLASQLRYLGEPGTWCRMAPVGEQDEITVTGRVWHARPLAPAQAPRAARDMAAEIRAVPAAGPELAVSAELPVQAAVVRQRAPQQRYPAERVPWPTPAAPRRRAEPRHRKAGAGQAPALPGPGGGAPAVARRPPQRERAAAAVAVSRRAPGRVSVPGGADTPPAWPGGAQPAARARSRASGRAEVPGRRPIEVAHAEQREVRWPAAGAAGRTRVHGGLATGALPAQRGVPVPRPVQGAGPATGPLPAQRGVPVPRPVQGVGPATGPLPAQRGGRPPYPAEGGWAQRPVPRPVQGGWPPPVTAPPLGGGWAPLPLAAPDGAGQEPRRGQALRSPQDPAEARARMPLPGAHRIVILGCTSGAGQTVTALMVGRFLATLRGQTVGALDLNPGSACLAVAAQAPPVATISDLLDGTVSPVRGGRDRPGGRIEIIQAGPGPMAAPQFDERTAARISKSLAARYALSVIDPATTVIRPVLAIASQLVLVAPAGADAPQAVTRTGDWLAAHGYEPLLAGAVMVLNGVSDRSLADVERAEAIARGRCGAIVRVPWEDQLVSDGTGAEGEALRPQARRAITELAGVIVAGLAASAGDTR